VVERQTDVWLGDIVVDRPDGWFREATVYEYNKVVSVDRAVRERIESLSRLLDKSTGISESGV
jgi:hypothetical protein